MMQLRRWKKTKRLSEDERKSAEEEIQEDY